MNIVEIRNLTKNYPSFHLNGVSFDIEAGKITGFIGRNGAGKTTTIKAMLNLIHPDGGEITYSGRGLTGNEAEIKKKVGYSAGAVNWYPHRKLSELIAVRKRFYDTWDENTYRKYLTLFGLDENKSPREMSDGMRVKSTLLTALSHRPELFILDEPTSGLDPFSRDELLDIFEMLKNDGAAVFFSTHIISDIEKCADNLVYIREGEIAAAMPKAAFIEKYSLNGENLEQTLLRLERGDINA